MWCDYLVIDFRLFAFCFRIAYGYELVFNSVGVSCFIVWCLCLVNMACCFVDCWYLLL